MLTAHKRPNPYAMTEVMDEDMMDVCSSVKRPRGFEENTPLKKRSYSQANVPPEQFFTSKDLERAREEVRIVASTKIKSMTAANESLRQALQEALQERDKLAHECKVLKAGVVTLNNRNTQLGRDLELTQAELRDSTERNKVLQGIINQAAAAMQANWSMGGCRRDDHGDSGPSYDGDVY